ncbi:MAG: FG-GAP repeat domain-containing protein, partial [Xanthobacteraceae bacterium]
LLGPIGGDWHVLAFGDFNGDGTDDVLTQRDGDHLLNVYTFQNSQITAATSLGQIGSEWHFLDAGDFNNDGTSDLLWQRESDHMLLMQQVNGNQIGASASLMRATIAARACRYA